MPRLLGVFGNAEYIGLVMVPIIKRQNEVATMMWIFK